MSRAAARRRGGGADLALSATSQAARFLAAAVLFIAFARLWPPETFGAFAFHNALAVLLALVAGYGMPVKVLRDAARAPAAADAELAGASALQVSLLAPCAAVAVALRVAGIVEDLLLLLLLLLAYAAANLVETAYGVLRARGRFADEARSAAIGNLLYFALPVVAVWQWRAPELAAAAMLLARIAQLALLVRLLRIAPARPEPAQLRAASPYALETIAAGIFLQADSLAVKLLLGDAALGLYQAGVRFVVVALVFAQAVNSIFLPRLAAAPPGSARFRAVAARSLLALAGWGLLCLLLLAATGDQAAALLYGPEYGELQGIVWLFGLLILLRCLAAWPGIILTAMGRQLRRFAAMAAAAALFVLLAVPAAQRFGLAGIVWANAGAVGALAIMYLAALRRRIGG